MNFWNLLNILLNLLTLINTSLAIVICLSVFYLIICFHRHSRSVPILLASHTCSILIISAIMLAHMSTVSLLGFAGISLEQHGETNWCRWRGFLIHGFLCSLYDSYILQAGYRLCRVVFYRRQRLHSFLLYLFLVPIGSLFGVVSISPVLIRGDIVYLSTEYYCQTPFTNLPAICYVALRLFLLPLVSITLAYVYLLKYVRKANGSPMTNQQRTRQDIRDLTVIRRLLVMLGVLILLGLPSIVFLSILMFTGHLVAVAYRIGWLSVSFSLIFLAYMLIQLTHPLKRTVKRLLERQSVSRDHGGSS